MSNLAIRIITSVLLLPLFLGLIVKADPVYIAAVAVVLAGMGGFEFAGMALGRKLSAYRYLASSLTAVVAGAIGASGKVPVAPLLVLITIPPLCLALFMFRSDEMESSFRNAAATITGIFYAGGLFGAVALIALADNGRWWILLLLAAVILNDTGAYAAGRTLGKHKLHKRLSPNKTWEGSVGGLLANLAAVLVVRHLFLPDVELLPAIALGIILGGVAQVGDLMESFVKRSFNVKDAGNILPGHGGILDRLDGFMLGAPVVLLFTMLQ